MKTILTFFFLFLGFIVSAQDSEKEIKKVLNAQIEAWNKGNMEEYMKGYWNSDSLVFIGKNGPKYGWKTTLENYKKSYPDQSSMGILSFDITKVELINSDHAFVIGKWKLKREKDEPKGYFTLLFKKINGDWVIVADHSS
jgi:ketosteroid isomerase-like protein